MELEENSSGHHKLIIANEVRAFLEDMEHQILGIDTLNSRKRSVYAMMPLC
jgi:hypothetical protein